MTKSLQALHREMWKQVSTGKDVKTMFPNGLPLHRVRKSAINLALGSCVCPGSPPPPAPGQSSNLLLGCLLAHQRWNLTWVGGRGRGMIPVKGLCWSMPVLVMTAEFQLLLVAGCWHFCWQLCLLIIYWGNTPRWTSLQAFCFHVWKSE